MREEDILNDYQRLEQEEKVLLEKMLVQIAVQNIELYRNMNLFLPVTNPEMQILNITIFSNFVIQLIKSTTQFKNYAVINHPFYQEAVKMYQECNARVIETFLKLPTTHPIGISGAYYYLLKRGYFSVQHHFQRKNNVQDIALDIPNLGLEIITGKGVCRHIASHLNDILKEMNFTTTPVKVSLDDKIPHIPQSVRLPDLKEDNFMSTPPQKNVRSLEEYSFEDRLFKKISYFIGNHLINGIMYQEKAYWIDLMNLFCYHSKRDNRLYFYQDAPINYHIPLRNKILTEMYEIDQKCLKDLLSKQCASVTEIQEEYLLGQQYAQEQRDKFDQIYQENQAYYTKIVENLNQLQTLVEQPLEPSKQLFRQKR